MEFVLVPLNKSGGRVNDSYLPTSSFLPSLSSFLLMLMEYEFHANCKSWGQTLYIVSIKLMLIPASKDCCETMRFPSTVPYYQSQLLQGSSSDKGCIRAVRSSVVFRAASKFLLVLVYGVSHCHILFYFVIDRATKPGCLGHLD